MSRIERIVFATSNPGKIADVRAALHFPGFEILAPADVVGRGGPPEVEEGITSYRENARLKAEAFGRWSGLTAIGDDTGLEVRALGGAPGIISARYAGAGATARANTEKLLEALGGVRDRGALFRAVLVLVTPAGRVVEGTGELHGAITEQPRGGGGFGYDNVFEVDGLGETLAELKERGIPIETHRHRALKALFGGYVSAER